MARKSKNQNKINLENELFSSVLDILYKRKTEEDELVRPILPVKEWVTDQYYVGSDGVSLYPFWIQVMCDVFELQRNVNLVVLSGGIGCRPILSETQTSLGNLNLYKLKEKIKDNKIYVLTEDGEREISDVHFVGKRKTKKFRFSNNLDYEVTCDHLLRIINNGNIVWKMAEELKVGDYILCTSNCSIFPDKEHEYEKYAYLIGYYIGDGDFNKSNGAYRLCYGEHKYSTQSYQVCLRLFKELSKTNNIYVSEGRTVYPIKDRDKHLSKFTGKTTRRFYCYTDNKDILDCGINASEKHIPDYTKYFTKNGTCELIAGIFDSDANFYVGKNNTLEIRLSSRSSVLVNQVQNILLNLGILCSVKVKNREHSNKGIEYSLSIDSFYSQELFNNIIPLKVEYKKLVINNFINLKRSDSDYDKSSRSLKINGIYNLLNNYCSGKGILKKKLYLNKCENTSIGKIRYIKHCIGDSFDNETLDYLDRNNCYSLRVESIENNECECGDIEVDGSHTYISNGIINHNTGKSTCGLFMMVRMLYELSCHKNIHKYLKLHMESALIVFLYFSLSKFVAKRTGFKQFRDLVDSIPYFRDNFPTDPKSRDEVRFPSNVYFLYGTGTGDAIGSNMLCSLLDEANFFSNSSGDSNDFNKVAELHRSLVARQVSRFMKNGENKSLSIVVSSATFKSSYTEELRKKAFEDSTIRFYRARKWDIEPNGTYSTTEFFYVYCGDDKVDPFIIEDVSDISSRLGLNISGKTVKEVVEKLPIEYRSLVDEIPIDFKSQYETNIIKSLQDFSGYSTESTNMLFSNRTVFNSCIDDSIPELFFSNEFTIETGNNNPNNNISYYMKDIPFINPNKPRYIHVDLGITNDACGIACCHKSGETDVDGVKHDVYTFDFTLRIVPPKPPKKMSITRVEEFIIYLRDKLHLTIGMVSYDNFQSAGSIQRLGDLGFNVRLQSVDRDDKAYIYFVENLYLRTVKFNSTFASAIDHELFNLIHYVDKHKVDHPSDTKHGGMKDRVDAIVGSLYNAFEDKTVRVNLEDNMNLSSYNIEHDIKDDYLKGMNGYDY